MKNYLLTKYSKYNLHVYSTTLILLSLTKLALQNFLTKTHTHNDNNYLGI